MRVFIALELSREIKKELEKVQNQLKKAGAQATWVKPEIAHLTLAFLGSITSNQVETIHQVLEEIGQGKPIQLELGQVGCFPHPAKPRVIFVSLKGELVKLNSLVKQIREGLKKEKIGFDKKPFRTHVTLGRVKKRQNLTPILKGIKVKKTKFLAQEITLIKSELTPSGPVYSKLKRISFS
jgi:2'-5' RNA ligase